MLTCFKNKLNKLFLSLFSVLIIFSFSFPSLAYADKKANSVGMISGTVAKGLSENCAGGGSSADFDPEAEYEEIQKQTAYAVIDTLKMLGASDNFIIGALANIKTECNYDYRIWEGSVVDFPGRMFFDASNPYINPDNNFWRDYVKKQGDVYTCGIGFTQWSYNKTGATSAMELLDMCDELNTSWQIDLKVQCAYYIKWLLSEMSTSAFGYSGGIAGIKDSKTKEEWTLIYAKSFERCGASHVNGRLNNISIAEKYLSEHNPTVSPVDPTSIDLNDNKALYELAGGTAISADCGTGISGNSSIAEASVSLAFDDEQPNLPGHEKRTLLDGVMTQKYADMFQEYIGGLPAASCDASACTAIRWSEADPEFPSHSTVIQLQYCLDNPDKWKQIGVGTMDELESSGKLLPGDVIVKDGHIRIYCGAEEIQKQFPGVAANKTFVCGSLGERGPKTGGAYPDVPYHAFRSTGKSVSGT